MSFTKGTWKVSGDFVIAKQNEEDYVRICRNLASSDDARLVSAAPNLLEACKAWMKVEAEMRENNPCPDLALRAQYRKEAVKITEAAISKTKE